MFKNRWKLLSLVLIGVIGIIAGAVYAASHGETEVRVSALRHHDGRVEVTVQQIDTNGDWGERIRPQYRIVPTGRTGVWLNSSPVSVQVAEEHADEHADGRADDQDAAPDVAMPTDEAPAELYCVVHHGSDTDQFWQGFNGSAALVAHALGLTNVEIHGEADIADQAAAITDCAGRGAVAIASSIPNLDGLKDALDAARNSGALLLTFNSGADVAGQVGSTVHYGLDDHGAGATAGQEFNDAGVTGTVLCVQHEEQNVGLDDRCDGLEGAYDGAVERVQLPAGSLSDDMTAGAAMAQAIMQHEAAGVLVLNGSLAHVATGTVAQIGSEATVGVIGSTIAAPFLVDGGQLLFAIGDGSQEQATHVMLALKNVDANPSARAILALAASQSQATSTMLLRPFALNQDYLETVPDGFLQQACAVAKQIAPALASAYCEG